MSKNFIQKHAFKLGLFSIYLVVSVIYLIKLFQFNETIINYKFLKIVSLPESWDYLMGATLLLALGLLYLGFLYSNRWEISTDASALLILVLLAILTIIIMILIIYAIQNPVLRAFLLVYIVGHSIIYAQNG